MVRGFTFFESYYEAIAELEPEDQLAVYDAITRYSLYGFEPELSGVAKAIFAMAKPTIDRCQMRKEAGSHGGRKRAMNAGQNVASASNASDDSASKVQANSKQTSSKTQASCKQTLSDRDRDRDRENISPPLNTCPPLTGENRSDTDRAKRFKKPTVDEVRAYCDERRNGIDAQAFCDFYEAKGWRIGKEPMKDWKASVRTWERNRRNGTSRSAPPRNNSDSLDAAILAWGEANDG